MKIPAWLRTERAILASLFTVALALRVGAGIAGQVMTHDGARFTIMARLLDHAQFGAAMDVWPHMPPMYPLWMHAFGRVFGDYGTAGVAVSALFGALAVLPLFALAKAVANERIAAVATLIYAFLPEVAILGGEVMSEPLFLFFFLSWMWLLWSGSREPHWTKFALAGAAAAAAYLTRPEGIYAVLGTVGWCAISVRRHNALKLAGGAALFLLVFLVASWPYLLWIKSTTGKWGFTANPFASGIVDRLEGKSVPIAKEQESREDPMDFKENRDRAKFRWLGPFVSLSRETVKVCFYVFLPLGLLGLWRLRGWGPSYLILMMVGYGLPTIIGMYADQPFGYRYILPSCVFATPFMAVGAMEVLGRLRRWRWVPAVLAIAMLGIMTVKIVKPRRGDRWDLKEAGLWIRSQGEDLRIASMDRRVEHYAHAWYVKITPRYEDLPKDVRFVVLYRRQLKGLDPGYLDRMKEEWVLVHQVGDVLIFAPPTDTGAR